MIGIPHPRPTTIRSQNERCCQHIRCTLVTVNDPVVETIVEHHLFLLRQDLNDVLKEPCSVLVSKDHYWWILFHRTAAEGGVHSAWAKLSEKRINVRYRTALGFCEEWAQPIIVHSSGGTCGAPLVRHIWDVKMYVDRILSEWTWHLTNDILRPMPQNLYFRCANPMWVPNIKADTLKYLISDATKKREADEYVHS